MAFSDVFFGICGGSSLLASHFDAIPTKTGLVKVHLIAIIVHTTEFFSQESVSSSKKPSAVLIRFKVSGQSDVLNYQQKNYQGKLTRILAWDSKM